MADTYFSSVVLLLHCNGSDASTTFTDTSPTPKTVSVFGNAQLDTADKVFGSASALFDGTGDYITVPNSTDMTLTAGDFTIEFWIKLNATGANIIIAQQANGTGTYPWQVWFENSTSKFGFRGFASNGSTSYAMQETGTSTTGVWYHLAAVRDGTTFRFFKDGAANGTATLSGALFAAAFSVSFGATNNAVVPLNGWLDDIRVTKGVARYTGAFTPPAAEFEDFGFTTAYLSDTGLPSPPSVLTAIQVLEYLSDTGPLQQPSVLGRTLVAQLSDGGLPLAPTVRTWSLFATIDLPGILEAESFMAFHDFRPLVHTDSAVYPITYTMDLVTPGGDVTVPISSWQATLQTDTSCYASAVIPKCADWLEDVYVATEFIIWRNGYTLTGEAFKHQMVRAPLDQYQVDQGPTNHTCSLSAYFDPFEDFEDPHERYDSTLVGLRSISNYASGLRIRCAFDWLMQPGQRAYYGEPSFVVSYMNYYVNGSDEYIDVGRREDAA